MVVLLGVFFRFILLDAESVTDITTSSFAFTNDFNNLVAMHINSAAKVLHCPIHSPTWPRCKP